MFQTVYDDSTIKNIYSFSDIHGDIHSLIIALRDCAKVIKKKENKKYLNTPDLDMEQLLKIDISIDDNGYIDDLNYEWDSNITNTYVVIIGDIIDATRRGSYYKSHKDELITPTHWYHQVEIKILRFINSIHEQALLFNSKIIKLLGNHEAMNVLGYKDQIKKYAFKEDVTSDIELQINDYDKMYYGGDTRLNTFLPGRHGFELLMKHGVGILVRVNNNIFIHGQLVDNITQADYIRINIDLNSTDFNVVKEALAKINQKSKDNIESPLWARTLGNPDNIHERLNSDGESICLNLKQLLQMFVGPEHDISDLRLIIGHCIQSRSTTANQINRTFSKIDVDESRQIEYISSPARTSTPDIKNNFIFGITMECSKPSIHLEDSEVQSDDHYLYRVDIGASRGFDSKRDIDIITTHHTEQTHNDLEKRYLYSRTPQVLELGKTVRIIRSRLKNTRIHQRRAYYEDYIKSKPELASLDLDLSPENYYYKYLKYKFKYLKLLK
jgi:hypothetical protein